MVFNLFVPLTWPYIVGEKRHVQTEPIKEDTTRRQAASAVLCQYHAARLQAWTALSGGKLWCKHHFPCKVVKPRTNSKTLKVPTQGYQPPPYIIKLSISGLVFSIMFASLVQVDSPPLYGIVPPQKARSPQPSFLGKLRAFPNQRAKFWSILRGWFPHEFP